MPVHIFSTTKKRKADEELVLRVKSKCATRKLTFSSIVLAALRQYEKDNLNG